MTTQHPADLPDDPLPSLWAIQLADPPAAPSPRPAPSSDDAPALFHFPVDALPPEGVHPRLRFGDAA